jgi:hypothetical protein
VKGKREAERGVVVDPPWCDLQEREKKKKPMSLGIFKETDLTAVRENQHTHTLTHSYK